MSNIVKIDEFLKKNIKNHTSINLTRKLAKITDSADLNHVSDNRNGNSLHVNDYKCLFKYYKSLGSDELPNKALIAKELNKSISTITNWNNKLKEEGKIKTMGKQIFILRGE